MDDIKARILRQRCREAARAAQEAARLDRHQAVYADIRRKAAELIRRGTPPLKFEILRPAGAWDKLRGGTVTIKEYKGSDYVNMSSRPPRYVLEETIGAWLLEGARLEGRLSNDEWHSGATDVGLTTDGRIHFNMMRPYGFDDVNTYGVIRGPVLEVVFPEDPTTIDRSKTRSRFPFPEHFLDVLEVHLAQVDYNSS